MRVTQWTHLGVYGAYGSRYMDPLRHIRYPDGSTRSSLTGYSWPHSLTHSSLTPSPSLTSHSHYGVWTKLFNFIFFWQFNYSGFEKENLNLQSPRHERIKQETKRPMDPCTSRTKQLGLLKGPYR